MTIDWLLLTPALAPAAGALLVLLLDLLPARAGALHRWPQAVGALACAIGLGGVLAVAGRPATSLQPGDATDRLTLCTPAPEGACFVDLSGPAVGLAASVLLSGLAVAVLMWPTRGDRPPVRGSVPIALLLAAVTGGVVVASGRDVATWLVGLELATVPLVALVALTGGGRAAHGALSFVLTSVLSFALLAVGAALWVVATGHPALAGGGVTTAWQTPSHRPALALSVLLALAGLGFKVAAVPFHTWVPPTYAASPTAVTTALATVSKVAAVAGLVALVRPLAQAHAAGVTVHAAALGLGLVAAVTMTVGGVVALRQHDVVRLIAWSAIAQGGWLLLALASLSEGGLRAASAYAVAYALATVVVLAVVAVVSGSGTAGREVAAGRQPTAGREPAAGRQPTAGREPAAGRELAAYTGLFRRHPGAAFALTLGLLSLAGVPPGVLGLVAKVAVLGPVTNAGLWWLAVVAALNVVLGLAVYLRWVRVLLQAPEPGAPVIDADGPRGLALGLSVSALVGLSVLPQLVLSLVR